MVDSLDNSKYKESQSDYQEKTQNLPKAMRD